MLDHRRDKFRMRSSDSMRFGAFSSSRAILNISAPYVRGFFDRDFATPLRGRIPYAASADSAAFQALAVTKVPSRVRNLPRSNPRTPACLELSFPGPTRNPHFRFLTTDHCAPTTDFRLCLLAPRQRFLRNANGTGRGVRAATGGRTPVPCPATTPAPPVNGSPRAHSGASRYGTSCLCVLVTRHSLVLSESEGPLVAAFSPLRFISSFVGAAIRTSRP